MTLAMAPDTTRDTNTAHLMTAGQLAAFLQLDTERLYDMRRDGTGPRFVKIGRDVRYAWPEVRAWLDARTHDTIKATRVA